MSQLKINKDSEIEWFTLTRLLTYTDGIFYFADTVRNIGKTWGLQKYAWRRAFKHAKKAIFVRKSKKEAYAFANSIYTNKDVITFCKGLMPYNSDTKRGNMKRKGRTFYIKRNKRWEWFLKISYVSEFKDLRGTDDPDCDRILYDEYTTTVDRQKLFKGNEVENFIDMTISIARQHDLKVIFCGNKESINNPYYTYFEIPPLPINYQGIRTYRHGTIVIQQYNQTKFVNKGFEKRLKWLLEGTAYGDYLFNADYKNAPQTTFKQPPAAALGYSQFIWKGTQLKVLTHNDKYYVTTQCDTTTLCLTDKIYPNLRLQKQLAKKQHRNLFRGWQAAYLNNKIYYQNAKAYDTTHEMMKWFGIVNT